ncbi:DUF624 domain-containing protein [Caldibacillus lycopersici]|uniref:DUF624 domain-containing protein n=1 Tax=Perspicuibacillus lycopersici TaxID=1325689 RepID=A0AAE3IUZ2_9BACI|nr:DUF624 domain-containing protein [Perspicuibacillus lycopersici]MCU9615125.1 DUF624 domain-containing protein [Perspicuibacillus lycopersici]
MKINYHSPFWQRMEKLYYVILLNLLWILFSLPIITIGASTAALYHTTFNLVKGKDVQVFTDFYHAFKLNFVRNMVMGLFVICFGLLLMLVQGFYLQLATEISQVIYYLYLFVTFLFILFLVNIFPVLGSFKGSFLEIARITLFLSIKYLPMSILMIIINFFILYLCQFVIPLAVIAVALIAFVNSHIFLKKVLKVSFTAEELSSVN